MFKNSSLGVK